MHQLPCCLTIHLLKCLFLLGTNSSRFCLCPSLPGTGGASSGLVPGDGEVQEIHRGDAEVGETRATVGSQGGLHGEGVLEMNFEDVMRS